MGFFKLRRKCGVSQQLRWGTQVSSCVAPGQSSVHSSFEGELGIALDSLQGIQPQDALKGEFRGLSRVAAGNPGFPRFVTVTSGSILGCLWEVTNTVKSGGASRDSTGFGAMDEGLI